MRDVIVLMASAILIASGIASGAGFDCAKAVTRVEKMICASEVLSRLDEQLAEAYKSVIRSSDDPDGIKRSQRAWLRDVREPCRDETCLKAVYESRLGQLAAPPGHAAWQCFRDPHLGIEFSYPSDRTVKIACRSSKNCIALIGTPMPNSDYIIAFEVFDGGLETVAAEKAVFEKKTGGWTAAGRSGEYPVEALAGPGWQGVKSIVDCGISDSRGFHAGAGECLWVVLSNGSRSVVADTQGIVGIDDASMQSIQSIRFIK